MIDRISRLFRRPDTPDTPAGSKPPAAAEQQAQLERLEQERSQQQAEAEQRLQEVARLDDSGALIALALQDKSAKVRLAAAQKLTGTEALEQLRRDSNDKAVQRHARDTLKILREQEQAAADTARRVRQLLDSISQHAARGLEPLYEAKLESLQANWRELATSATAAEQERFAEQAALCRQTIASHADEIASRQQATAARAELLAACTELEAAVAQLGREDLTGAASGVAALRSIQQTRWDEAASHTTPDAALATRFRNAARLLDRWLHATGELASAGAEAATLFAAMAAGQTAPELTEDATDTAPPTGVPSALEQLDDWQHQLDALRARIDWPAEAGAPALLADIDAALRTLAGKRRALQADVRDQLAQLRKRRGALKHMIDEGQLRVAVRTRQWLQKRLAELPAREAAQETAALAPLDEALAKLHDWYEFASVPKKTGLCEQIEALPVVTAFANAEDTALRAEEIRSLRERWNALCAADPDADPELRARFDRAAGLAFAPCAAWYEAQHKVQDQNLAARVALCTELAGELATLTTTPPVDAAGWRALEQHERELRARWKSLEPVRWPEARATQDRFHGLLAQLRALLANERDGNAARKKELVERARALLVLEPLPAALGAAKALQDDWKKIGWTDQRADRALWQQFRGALDAVFARREQARDADRLARDAERAARDAEAAEQARKRAEEDAKRVERAQALRAARQQHIEVALALAAAETAQLDGGTADHDALAASLDTLPEKSALTSALRARLAQLRAATASTPAQLAANADQLARLTLELEILLDLPSPPELAQARMQAKIGQLNSALRQRSGAGNNSSGKDVDPRRTLEDAWLAVGPVAAAQRAPLLARFQRALGA